MRTKKSLLNAGSYFIILVMRTIMLFFVRIVFVKVLGEVYLGIDSLFTNILSAVSIIELGINTAINYSLYKPLANKNYDKVSTLMAFYKKIYYFSGLIVFIIGIIVSLFLGKLVDTNVNSLYLFYYLYLINTVSIYFISYKEVLIFADQNNYQLTGINFFFYMLLYGLRIIGLLLFKDFLIYILLLVIITIIQHGYINYFITKKYSNVDFNCQKIIDKQEKRTIFSNIKAMFMHKTGSYVINGTDNIIISATNGLGIVYVGIYTNYLSIVTMVNTIFTGIYKGITSSFGNLAALENENTQENVYNIINFLGFILYGFTTIAFYFLLTDFITICFGEKFQLSNIVVLIICLNFYFNGMILNLDLIKDATGTYVQDRYAPIIQAIINLIISIILAKYIGLLGVVLGTLISIIVVPLWNKPYIVYKYIFKSKITNYILNQFKYLLFLFMTFISLYLIFNFVNITNIYLLFIIKIFIIVMVYIILFYIVYSHNGYYKYLKKELINIIKERKNK